MATNILMPALSPTMEQGKLAKWLKKEGDTVRSGDVLAEIETDKATMEVEAIDDGTLAKILVPDGTDNVAVNTPIAVIVGEGEDAGAVRGQAVPHRTLPAIRSPSRRTGAIRNPPPRAMTQRQRQSQPLHRCASRLRKRVRARNSRGHIHGHADRARSLARCDG